jgi:hypothetical protein
MMVYNTPVYEVAPSSLSSLSPNSLYKP